MQLVVVSAVGLWCYKVHTHVGHSASVHFINSSRVNQNQQPVQLLMKRLAVLLRRRKGISNQYELSMLTPVLDICRVEVVHSSVLEIYDKPL